MAQAGQWPWGTRNPLQWRNRRRFTRRSLTHDCVVVANKWFAGFKERNLVNANPAGSQAKSLRVAGSLLRWPQVMRRNVRMFPSKVLAEIATLDPVKDHQRIVFLSCRADFPFDTTRALEFALFRTFCVPAVSALLDRTGEFQNRAQKRYDDTDIIISEMMEHGYDSERGRAALRRMNQIHERFTISNDDYLYVLSTFIFEPIRWNERFGWRRMTEKERLALFCFWREVGRRMNIKAIPAEYAEFERFNVEYEARHYRFTETNHRVGEATRRMFLSWFPKFTWPLVSRAIYAALDDALIRAFGFPPPSRFMRWFVASALRTRGQLLRFLPRRKSPLLRTALTHRTYPQGYRIEELGPNSAKGK